jgi:trehalose 6-phosphate phosphatase
MTQPLFDAMQEVGNRIRFAPFTLLCLNYDGTLTQHVEEPGGAFLSPQVERVLLALAGHDTVALVILSGRERADLQKRVPIPGAVYVGNHGLEISGPGMLYVEPASAERVGALQELTEALTRRLEGIPGVQVEFKGLTVTVHYRQSAAESGEEIRRLVHSVLANASHPFVLTAGEMAYEIRPRVYWNKGSAVKWIRDQLLKPQALVVYLGEDATDEDAFAALRDGITIKAGGAGETAAQYTLEGPADVRRFLEWVEELMRQREPARTVIPAESLKETAVPH